MLQLNWAKLYVDETVQTRYCKPRPVPLAMRANVESELYRPQEEGVIRPVAFSEWAAPIVPVSKASSEIRICDDYKVAINQAVKVDKHPSSRISHADCMSRLPLPDAPSHVPVPRKSSSHSRPWTKLRSTQTKSRNGHLPILCSHKCDAL